ncbi:MAG: hypothetical protein QXP51_04765 [Candidatus Hadarchaeales archaeon]
MQIVPTTQSLGTYLVVDPIVAAKVEPDLRDVVWPDGSPRPTHNYAAEDFRWETYKTRRYTYPITIGQITADNAQSIGWDILAAAARHAAMRAMTARTVAVKNALDSVMLPTGHQINVQSTYGATWANSAASGSGSGVIRKSIIDGVRIILQSTLGVVSEKDLVLVIGPQVAAAMRNSDEIIDLIKQSPYAGPMLQHQEIFDEFGGLPSTLYGVRVVVDRTMQVSSRIKARPKSVNAVWGTTNAYLLARPGQLLGQDDSVNYSSVVFFMREEMNVESIYDNYNRLHHAAVTEEWDARVVAPATVVRFTNIV